jgi:hypothetical protein
MRRAIFASLFVLATSTAASAVGAGWHGPGWYVLMNTPVKQHALYRGAYKTEQECLAAKPADHGSIEFDCVELNRQPMDG